MTNFAIEASLLSKSYPTSKSLFNWSADPEKDIVTDVSLKVETGEIFGLTGSNGAGKTTLIKMLCTLIAPTSGSASIAGIPLELDRGDEIRRRAGLVVTDDRSFYWRLTGRQNLVFFAALYGIFDKEAENRAEQLLVAVDLTDAADIRFDRYSSGMKQRLAIARGLLHRPEILFLDEPGRSLDSEAKGRLHELVRTLNETQNMTVFLITHDQTEAKDLCDRIGVMHSGKLVDILTNN
ncbi:MAG: ABC transporter ATP-binding protein [Anaerolineae bacterium]